MKQVVFGELIGVPINLCIVNDQLIDEQGVTIDRDFNDEIEEIFVTTPTQKSVFLPEVVTETIPNLIQYDTTYTKLKHINNKNFKNLIKLRSLYLDSSNIETITSYAFKNLRELETLHIGNNPIEIVDPKWFQSLPKLYYLQLSYIDEEAVDCKLSKCIQKINFPIQKICFFLKLFRNFEICLTGSIG